MSDFSGWDWVFVILGIVGLSLLAFSAVRASI
jgi:hypothetical protein